MHIRLQFRQLCANDQFRTGAFYCQIVSCKNVIGERHVPPVNSAQAHVSRTWNLFSLRRRTKYLCSRVAQLLYFKSTGKFLVPGRFANVQESVRRLLKLDCKRLEVVMYRSIRNSHIPPPPPLPGIPRTARYLGWGIWPQHQRGGESDSLPRFYVLCRIAHKNSACLPSNAKADVRVSNWSVH